MTTEHADNSGNEPANPENGSSNETLETPKAPESWLTGLPDEIKSSPSLTKFNDVEALARSYLNAEQLIGRDKIPMPKTDAEYAEVFERLGKPKTAADYQLAKVEGLPPDVQEQFDADIEWFRNAAFANHLTGKQAAELQKQYFDRLKNEYNANEAKIASEMTAAETTLKSEWGATYGPRVELANRFMREIFGEDVAKAIEATGLGRNVDFIKGMAKLGEAAAEDLGIDKQNKELFSPDEIRAKLSEVQAHPAYLDSTHPEHGAKVNLAFRLQQKLYPS